MTSSASASPDRVLRRLFLTLFLRGRSARGLRRDHAPQSLAAKLALTLVLYALVGCMALFFARGPVFSLSLYLHGMTLVFCGMFTAASAGEMLFSKDEADILLHRPVTPRALLRAKMTVLLQVSLWISGAFNLAGTFAGLNAMDASPLFPVAHLISTIFEALFCTSCVVLGYETCLRCFGRERLDNLMTTVQVVVAVGAVLAGQLVPRLIDHVGLRVRTVTGVWWLNLLPPAWFASFDDAVAGSGSLHAWALGLGGVLVTILAVWLALGRMARHYLTGLQVLGEATASKPGSQGRRRWLAALVQVPPLSWWLRDPVERHAFLLVTRYLVRDRDVKLRVYPGVVPMLVMPAAFLFPLHGQHGGPGGGFSVAFAGSYLGMIPLFVLSMLQYSQQWPAADVFRTAPLPGPAALSAGARKAVTCFITMPLVLGLLAVILGWHRQLEELPLLIPGLIAIPILTLVPHRKSRAIPLSSPTEEARSANRGLDFMVVVFASMGLALLATWAWLTGWFAWLLLGEAILAGIAFTTLRASLARAPWPAIE